MEELRVYVGEGRLIARVESRIWDVELGTWIRYAVSSKCDYSLHHHCILTLSS